MNRKFDLIQRLGFASIVFGWFFSLMLFFDGYIVPATVLFIIGVIGLYLMYYPYPRMKNIVAVPERFKDVYYDEKGLYYDIPGKPYLFIWDEVKGYNIVSVEEVEDTELEKVGIIIPYPILFETSVFATSVTRFLLKLSRYIAWRKIDPEYAKYGVMKLGTVQFIKKDGSVILLSNVINPYRLEPIFKKYIKVSNEKKEYHM
jgi:uncharacterized membrane protein